MTVLLFTTIYIALQDAIQNNGSKQEQISSHEELSCTANVAFISLYINPFMTYKRLKQYFKHTLFSNGFHKSLMVQSS